MVRRLHLNLDRGQAALGHAADDRHAPVASLDDSVQDPAARALVERRGLAGRPKRKQTMDAAGQDVFNESPHPRLVDAAVAVQWRSERYEDAREPIDFEHRRSD